MSKNAKLEKKQGEKHNHKARQLMMQYVITLGYVSVVWHYLLYYQNLFCQSEYGIRRIRTGRYYIGLICISLLFVQQLAEQSG